MNDPVFLFSLPRSGSTLLQKVLSSHSSIVTSGEPSLMLSVALLLKKEGILTDACHRENLGGIHALISRMENGETDYYSYLREFCLKVYGLSESQKNVRFLDKTPKYLLIIDEIAKTFPSSKFIFLTRNPADILCSSVETWGQGRLLVHSFIQELYDAPALLVDGFRKHLDRSVLVSYERFMNCPQQETAAICNHLGISYEDEMLQSWGSTQLNGGFGDPIGVLNHQSISSSSIGSWKDRLATMPKKILLLHYLKSVPGSYFKLAGIDQKALVSEIRGEKISSFDLKNCFLLLASLAFLFLNLKYLRPKYSDVKFRKLG